MDRVRYGSRAGGGVIQRWILPAGLVAMLPAMAGQDAPPRYAAAMLSHAAFDESVVTTIRTQAGAATLDEAIGRVGRWQLRAVADSGTVLVEAWYDSLRVWRDGPDGRLEPDTDGLVGGRYRGSLSPDGRYRPRVRPFQPDELAAATDLGDAMTRFLPPLAPVPLAEGASWDGGALRVVRRSDSVAAGTRVARYRWVRTEADTSRGVAGDSAGYVIRSTLRETGDLSWDPVTGPLGWDRLVVIELDVPAEGAVRRATRSRIEERASVRRRPVP